MHCKRRGSEKSTFLAIFWGFWFSQDRLFSRNSTRHPLNLIKSPIFTNAPCKTACLYNAPSMHTVELWPCNWNILTFSMHKISAFGALVPKSLEIEACGTLACTRSLGNGVRKNGVRNRCPYRRCGVLGEGKWGRTKYRRIPESEGDRKGRVPKCSLPRKTP